MYPSSAFGNISSISIPVRPLSTMSPTNSRCSLSSRQRASDPLACEKLAKVVVATAAERCVKTRFSTAGDANVCMDPAAAGNAGNVIGMARLCGQNTLLLEESEGVVMAVAGKRRGLGARKREVNAANSSGAALHSAMGGRKSRRCCAESA